jgi:hypothetical protein
MVRQVVVAVGHVDVSIAAVAKCPATAAIARRSHRPEHATWNPPASAWPALLGPLGCRVPRSGPARTTLHPAGCSSSTGGIWCSRIKRAASPIFRNRSGYSPSRGTCRVGGCPRARPRCDTTHSASARKERFARRSACAAVRRRLLPLHALQGLCLRLLDKRQRDRRR